jgi:NADP-dependent 3-hydroxy acid dehydrogenase YdfG
MALPGALIIGGGTGIGYAEAIVEAAAAALGDVGVYVNCAGVYSPVRFQEMREAAWRDTVGPTLAAQVFPAVAPGWIHTEMTMLP